MVRVGHLEQVIAHLKLEAFFAFGQDELNADHGHWDVFPEVDDLDAFDPVDAGDAPAFLAWSGDAAAAAFDDAGVLRQPLGMRWGGSAAQLQTAFAHAGLAVSIERDDTSGRLVLLPDAAEAECDLKLAVRVCERLERRGIIALPNTSYTRSEGWSDVAERARERSNLTAVFWTEQDHEAFDGAGNLGSTLFLAWRGDAAAIIEEFRTAGFTVTQPPDEDHAIEVVSGPTRSGPHLTYAEVAAPAAERAAPAARIRVAHGGPLELVRALRSRDAQPVRRLEFDRATPGRFAFAQGLDDRDFPSAPGYIIAANGDIERALLPDQRAMGVGGMCFLRDGRFLLCTTQLRKLTPEDQFGTSCLVIHRWTPGEAREDELLVQPFSHISETSLMTVDAAERFVAIGQPQGADIYPPQLRGVEPQRLRVPDEPIRAYTRTAISLDGALVAWCDDWSAPLTCFSRATGEVHWQHDFGARPRSQLAFSPDATTLGLRVRRDDQVLWFDAATGEMLHAELTDATRGCLCFAWHPSGSYIAVGRDHGTVTLLGFPDARLLAEVAVLAHGEVTAVAFDPQGHLVVGGSKGDIAVLAVSPAALAASAPAAAPSPASPPTPRLATRGVHPLTGATGRITTGAFANHDATVRLVGTGGTKLRVAVAFLGRELLDDIDATAFRPAGDIGKVSPASPYQIGDVVFAHDGWAERGRERTVIDVEEAAERVLVSVPPDPDDPDDHESTRATLAWRDITLVRPLRRPPLPTYLAILDATRFLRGHQRQLSDWCVTQLAAGGWNLDDPRLAPAGPLAAEFATLEQHIWDECARDHADLRAQFLARFSDLTPEACVARWQDEWQTWAEWRVVPSEPTPWDTVCGDDDQARDRREMVFALRDRLQTKRWSLD